MRVACLIDSLVSGGAQRQMTLLAALLKRQGLAVTLVTYHPFDFFKGVIEEAGVAYRCIRTDSVGQRALALRYELRSGEYDAVVAFLDASCIYAELAALPWRKWGLVVSERLAALGGGWRERLRRRLHLVADYVTTNSHTNRLLIERAVPQLVGRTITIYNAVDLGRFRPVGQVSARPSSAVRLVVAASYQQKKNLTGLIEAVAIARRNTPGLDITVDWYGGRLLRRDGRPDTSVWDSALALIEQRKLTGRVRLHPPSHDVASVYRTADALILPSFFEGLPNVVCEAMACARPVLMSAVCDAPNLVRDGYNGFLFDPCAPEDIARAIVAFASLSRSERAMLGARGRAMAEQMFDPARFAGHYSRILQAAANRERIEATHWLPEVPATAHRPVLAAGC